MASVVDVAVERRVEPRHPGGGARWTPQALLRPGQPIMLINITSRAALVESPTRLRPGAQTELQLLGFGNRTAVRGRLDRCFVAGLDPLRYRGVVMFDRVLDVADDQV